MPEVLFGAPAWFFETLLHPVLIALSPPFFFVLFPVTILVSYAIYVGRRVRAQGGPFLLRNLEELFCIPLFALIVYLVFLQVYFRYVLSDPIIWAEEVEMAAFTWVIFVGSAVAYKHGERLAIETFVGRLPARFQRIIFFVTELLIFAALLILIYYGVRIAIIEWNYPSAALEFPQTLQSTGFPAGLALMAFHSARNILAMLRGRELPAEPSRVSL